MSSNYKIPCVIPNVGFLVFIICNSQSAAIVYNLNVRHILTNSVASSNNLSACRICCCLSASKKNITSCEYYNFKKNHHDSISEIFHKTKLFHPSMNVYLKCSIVNICLLQCFQIKYKIL